MNRTTTTVSAIPVRPPGSRGRAALACVTATFLVLAAGGTLASVGNFGGLAAGVVGPGLVAGWSGSPTPVFLVYLGALALAAVLVLASPETVRQRSRPRASLTAPTLPHGRRARRAFLGATNGAFSSLVPQLASSSLGIEDSGALGALVGLIFLTALAGQWLMPEVAVRRPAVSAAVLVLGLAAVTCGLLSGAAWLFVGGTLVAGLGVAWATRRGLLVAAGQSAPGQRAALSTSYYLGVYLGLIVPTLALGVVQQVVGEPGSTLFFAALVLLTVVVGVLVSPAPSATPPTTGEEHPR